MNDKVARPDRDTREAAAQGEPLAVVYVAIVCCAIVILIALGAYAIT